MVRVTMQSHPTPIADTMTSTSAVSGSPRKERAMLSAERLRDRRVGLPPRVGQGSVRQRRLFALHLAIKRRAAGWGGWPGGSVTLWLGHVTRRTRQVYKTTPR